MRSAQETNLRLIQVGVVAGLATCIIYPLVIFAHLPRPITAALIGSFGPCLAIGSLGVGQLLRLHVDSFCARIAPALNIVGGALFSSMLLVQFAVGLRAQPERVNRQVEAVWLGLDVAWDVYIGVATILFALAMLKHPRFGMVFGTSGILVAVVLLAFNLYTFPIPPANAGLIDLGPVIGLWYLVVTVQVWRSLGWARELTAGAGGTGT